jgi:recombination protein RecT
MAENKPVSLKTQLLAAREAVRAVVPSFMDADKVVRVALLACARDPKLRSADPLQVTAAVVKAASLGLVVGQTAHLLTFFNKRANSYDVVLVPDYRGLLDLARRSEKVLDIEARAVFMGEAFEVEYGAEPKLKHVPSWSANREYSHLLAVYAVAVLPGGEGQPPLRRWEVMTRLEIEAIRNRSRAKDDGPWVTDPVEMAKKTVLRRICKTLPQSPELMAALELDARADTGTVGMPLDGDSDEAMLEAAQEKLAAKTEGVRRRLAAGKEPSKEELEQQLAAAREAGNDDEVERLSVMLEGMRE